MAANAVSEATELPPKRGRQTGARRFRWGMPGAGSVTFRPSLDPGGAEPASPSPPAGESSAGPDLIGPLPHFLEAAGITTADGLQCIPDILRGRCTLALCPRGQHLPARGCLPRGKR